MLTTQDAAAQLEALGNPTRLSLYRLLVRAGHEGLSVGQCQQRLEIAASTLSHHVKALVIVGLISQERDGTSLICHANYDRMNALIAFLVSECCVDSQCGTAQSAA
jgi:DNA-binding transcriptional ArsR family regulator